MKYLWLFLISFVVLAKSPNQMILLELLPPPLKEFRVHHTTLVEAQKALGKADLNEGRFYYWEKNGLKYALELSFDEKFILKTIHYTFTEKRPPLEKVGSIDVKKLTPYPSEGKTIGRFLQLKEKEFEIIIDPISKTIHTVKLL